ncbi:MAG: membrane protein [Pirellulaceae bacterium]|nr:MAG: membrane protein [Pirellulaceae bacterium]
MGILLFIFLGAVLRDINLLILLAGAMIGIVLIQWRFSVGTLNGLTLTRHVPPFVAVDAPLDVEVQVINPKRWLAAWLVMIEERVEKEVPGPDRRAVVGRCVVHGVPPRGHVRGKYRLVFHQRGRYRISSSTLSTRYPLGLGRGWRELEAQHQIVVHPRCGQLTPRINLLVDQDRTGKNRSTGTAGVQEGEFYGLRPWVTGDSKRWIHWRTTARLGELSVRQFERRQQRQLAVLLDLYHDGTADCAEAVEAVISFVATLANHLVRSGRDKLSVGVAAQRPSAVIDVQSPGLLVHLLDRLAEAEGHRSPDLAEALLSLSAPLMRQPHLIVVSTRPANTAQLHVHASKSPALARQLARSRIQWLDARHGDLEPYFQHIELAAEG